MRRAMAMVFRAAAVALGVGPLVLVVLAWVGGDWRGAALAVGVGLVLGWVPGKVRLPLSLIVGCSLFAWGFLWGAGGALVGIVEALVTVILLLLTVREILAPRPFFSSLPGLSVGLGIHIAAAILTGTLGLHALTAPLYVLGAAFLALALFTLNGDSLDVGYAAHAKLRPARRVLRANRGLMLILCGLVAFAAAFDRISDFVVKAAQALARAVVYAVLWLMSLVRLQQVPTGPMGDDSAGMLPMEAAQDPSLLALILQYLFTALAVAALAVLGFFALRAAWRKLRALMGRLMAHIRRFSKVLGEDYVDDRQSLVDAGALRRAVRARAENALRRLTRRQPRWDQLTPAEKVRYRVKALYQKSPDREKLAPLTVREAAPLVGAGEPLVGLYERARYGEVEIGEEEVGGV